MRYIYAEAPSEAEVLRATEDVRLAKNVREKPASREDLENTEPVAPDTGVSYGDTVEIIRGEFEGEKGRVTNIPHISQSRFRKIIACGNRTV